VHGLANGGEPTIRHQPDRPRRIAAQRDPGAGPIVFEAGFGLAGTPAPARGTGTTQRARRRRHLAHPAVARAPRVERR
jgi:hypothetical protein